MKKSIFLLSLLVLLSLFSNVAYTVVSNDNTDQDKQQYVPGEVLIKFKEGVNPQSVLQEINIKATDVERIHSIKLPVTKFKKDYKFEKDSDGWYWFKGKNYKEVENIPDEGLFQEAYIQMGPEEKSLYRAYKIDLPEGITVEEAAAELEKNPNVEYAEPNYIMRIQMSPNDPYFHSSGSWGQGYDDLWGLKPDKLDCESAWDISEGEGVIVAVIDTGVDYNHEDLAANIWINEVELNGSPGVDDDGNGKIDDVRGWDFVGKDYLNPQEDNDPMDGLGHGTHCSGTIAAIGNNGIGVVGVAPKAKIMAIKGLDDTGSGDIDGLAVGVIYAADNGAQVLSNSWGGITSETLTNAFDYAYSKGCVSIAAAGNSNMDVSFHAPANMDSVIAVAATDHNDRKASFSNFGREIEVAAPGGDSYIDDGDNMLGRNILSLRSDNNGQPTDMYGDGKSIVGDKYYRVRGTSMACPPCSRYRCPYFISTSGLDTTRG